MQYNYIIGWDIGGAHIKAALLNNKGDIIALTQYACPLWRGISQLEQAIPIILRQFNNPIPASIHAITMTGELVDCFTDRHDGVAQIIHAMKTLLASTELFFFTANSGLFAEPIITPEHYSAIASANWLASATFTAQQIKAGLFIDIGSTTSDLVLIQDNQVIAQGISDYERLCTQELIYTGIIRTPVMAIIQSIPHAIHAPYSQNIGAAVTIMAEYFATMADVYRITGELNEAHDQTATADGAEKTVLASARRLSRLIGCDFIAEELTRWQGIAYYCRAEQLKLIKTACIQQLARTTNATIPLIGAGVGRFLIKQIALDLKLPYIDFSELLPSINHASLLSPADCAPAIAVAYLAKVYSRGDFNRFILD